MRFGKLASAYHLVQARHPHTEHTGHSKHPLPIIQETTCLLLTLVSWYWLDGQHQNQFDYIHCSQRWRNPIQSAKTRPRVDRGSDHELLIAKFRLKLKKVEKINKPFRYDLNQIPYNYTVDMTNRFKRLDMIDRVPEELCTEVHDTVHEGGMKTILKKKKCIKAK